MYYSSVRNSNSPTPDWPAQTTSKNFTNNNSSASRASVVTKVLRNVPRYIETLVLRFRTPKNIIYTLAAMDAQYKQTDHSAKIIGIIQMYYIKEVPGTYMIIDYGDF